MSQADTHGRFISTARIELRNSPSELQPAVLAVFAQQFNC
jgi:hypothetical protein